MFEYEYKEDGDRKALNEGNATFTIAEANYLDEWGQPLVTKTGEPKMVIVLSVKDMVGGTGKMFEHISAKSSWKLGQICSAVGRPELYAPEGKIAPSDLMGLTGSCVLKLNNGYLNVSEYKKGVLATVWQSNDEVPF